MCVMNPKLPPKELHAQHSSCIILRSCILSKPFLQAVEPFYKAASIIFNTKYLFCVLLLNLAKAGFKMEHNVVKLLISAISELHRGLISNIVMSVL